MQNIIVSIEALNQIFADLKDAEITKRHDMMIEVADLPLTIVALTGEEKGSAIKLYVYGRLFFDNGPDSKPQFVIEWQGNGEGKMAAPCSDDCDQKIADLIATVFYGCLLFVNSSESFNSYETSDENWGKWLEHLVIGKDGTTVTGKVHRGTDRPDLVCRGMTSELEYVRPCAQEEKLMSGEEEPYHKMRYYDYLVNKDEEV